MEQKTPTTDRLELAKAEYKSYLDSLQHLAGHLDEVLSAVDINGQAHQTSRGLVGGGTTNRDLVAASDNLTSEHSLIFSIIELDEIIPNL